MFQPTEFYNWFFTLPASSQLCFFILLVLALVGMFFIGIYYNDKNNK